jgi:undecaprenyl-phosphate 4-deoxy-4-formamido-L-arabinose transferase
LLLSTTSRIANVDVHHRSRSVGTSQYTVSKLLKLWMNGFTSFSVKPLRISTMIGFGFALFGFIFAIYAVIRKLTHPEINAGWASLMAMISVLGGVILIVLGITGEYIGRMYISMNRIPQYVVKEMKNCGKENSQI